MQLKSIALSSIFTVLLTACNSQSIKVDIDGDEQMPSYKSLVENEDLYHFYGYAYSGQFFSQNFAWYNKFVFPSSNQYVSVFGEGYRWNDESKIWELDPDDELIDELENSNISQYILMNNGWSVASYVDTSQQYDQHGNLLNYFKVDGSTVATLKLSLTAEQDISGDTIQGYLDEDSDVAVTSNLFPTGAKQFYVKYEVLEDVYEVSDTIVCKTEEIKLDGEDDPTHVELCETTEAVIKHPDTEQALAEMSELHTEFKDVWLALPTEDYSVTNEDLSITHMRFSQTNEISFQIQDELENTSEVTIQASLTEQVVNDETLHFVPFPAGYEVEGSVQYFIAEIAGSLYFGTKISAGKDIGLFNDYGIITNKIGLDALKAEFELIAD